MCHVLSFKSQNKSTKLADQQDEIFSFSHTFLSKSGHIRGWCPPPNGLVPPQWEILDPPLYLCIKYI